MFATSSLSPVLDCPGNLIVLVIEAATYSFITCEITNSCALDFDSNEISQKFHPEFCIVFKSFLKV